MKKSLLVFTILISMFSVVNISQANAEAGGYAVVNPETGVVHGVIVASSADPFENGGTMPIPYMGCPVGCVIVQQSTASSTGNVAGVHGPNVIFNSNTGTFSQTITDETQVQTVTESSSNTSAVETQVGVSTSTRVYEFGVQDLRNTDGAFQMTEVAPAQNTSALVTATTRNYVCTDREMLCSFRTSNSSNILVDESVSFSERSNAVQVETKIITEAKNKIREQLSLILSMLERWILN